MGPTLALHVQHERLNGGPEVALIHRILFQLPQSPKSEAALNLKHCFFGEVVA